MYKIQSKWQVLSLVRIQFNIQNQVCEDQSATVNSHAQQQNLAENCTISSARCITISICSSNKTQQFVADLTHQNGVVRCFWMQQQINAKIKFAVIKKWLN
ncbi:unnamed protein product [Paramecium pentaurelia]|uniref:Uncharacterized protein n=1 Tax=Paramecium pentaurelia TaxID=43138 RepID=A0A8S1XMR1_9CILI|nr:unnamed protein product [Paramecium pentaurelia]